MNTTTLLIGTFLILVGTITVIAPALPWPYAIPGSLIILGLWYLVRGFSTIA
jgi:hypothetical protein